MSKILVAGSSNIDMNAFVKTLPRPGETIGDGRFMQANGGKGANQAVAAGRLGGDVLFLTCVGDDMNGHMLKTEFEKDGINTSHIKFSTANPTGTALIFVSDDGENCIAVAPGANNDLLPSDVDGIRQELASASYLLIQMEVPSQTVDRAIALAHELGVKVVLNPAPVREISSETLSMVDILTPNETEAEKLTGMPVKDMDDVAKVADKLRESGVGTVIITLGSAGSYICSDSVRTLVPARKVTAVDTVGAGDIFNGALVTALSEGRDIESAVKFATLASSIAVTRPGAQTGVPHREEVDQLMK